MYHIAICDDDIRFCSHLESIIIEYQKKNYYDFKIDIFYSGETLYACLEQGSMYDFIFLDIEMQSLSGIAVGRKIRNELCNDVTHIVYVSSYPNYAMQLFKIRPIDFISKPVDKESIFEVIQQGLVLSNKEKKMFTYKTGQCEQKIEVGHILYFESRNRIVEMTTMSGKETFYSTLKGVYEKLNPMQFMYIHRSLIVNFQQVKRLNYQDAIMTNEEVLPIGKNYRKELRQYRKGTEERI